MLSFFVSFCSCCFSTLYLLSSVLAMWINLASGLSLPEYLLIGTLKDKGLTTYWGWPCVALTHGRIRLGMQFLGYHFSALKLQSDAEEKFGAGLIVTDCHSFVGTQFPLPGGLKYFFFPLILGIQKNCTPDFICDKESPIHDLYTIYTLKYFQLSKKSIYKMTMLYYIVYIIYFIFL